MSGESMDNCTAISTTAGLVSIIPELNRCGQILSEGLIWYEEEGTGGDIETIDVLKM